MYENKKSPEKNIIYLTMLQNLKEEEEEELKILNEPFRQYLMKYIFPTLTQGLIQVAKLRPADPVEYLGPGREISTRVQLNNDVSGKKNRSVEAIPIEGIKWNSGRKRPFLVLKSIRMGLFQCQISKMIYIKF
ncbi:uncharacterized protein LOC127288798 isoform X1 [Leptopilina boulardi]|uniref:uncharacterized protein LOC127288798 isoform X1 n=1 Tax=Leptopilina boulardi TaxID=63433 RepID=UPI0021F59EBD|nr:uncharacterized protein LOC127288798 isoform X1 [Leptopilina boulardi]